MSIVDGTGLIVWEGGLFEPGSDLLRRLQWAFAQIRAAGGTIILNEAGRPYGVPSDVAVGRAGLPESRTASGRSTVYYQWGRMLAGLTPSAANPALGPFASEHTQGLASDTNAPTVFDMTLRAHFFALAGMVQTIPSESWHFAIRGAPRVDIGTTTASSGVTPITPEKPHLMGGIFTPEEDDMPAPIYARGDQLDVWYALYPNTLDSTVFAAKAEDEVVPYIGSGFAYFSRRRVGAGERAIVQAYLKQTGKMAPGSEQTGVLVIPQKTFDGINKMRGGDASAS